MLVLREEEKKPLIVGWYQASSTQLVSPFCVRRRTVGTKAWSTSALPAASGRATTLAITSRAATQSFVSMALREREAMRCECVALASRRYRAIGPR